MLLPTADDLHGLPNAEDPLLAPGTADADVQLIATGGLLDAGDQIDPPVGDAQQPPEPPDLDQGLLRRSKRVVARKFSCLNFDNF